MQSHQEKIVARIAALRAKTVENGCTEDEAMTAAAKAAELLEQYEISEVQIAAAENRAFHFEVGRDDVMAGEARGGTRILDVLHALQGLCHVKFVILNRKANLFACFGDKYDRELAGFLVQTIHAAMDREWHVYKDKRRGNLSYDEKPSFMSGMANRINDRIHEIVRERDRPTRTVETATVHGTGRINVANALVPIQAEKEKLIETAVASAFVRLKTSRVTASRSTNWGAFQAGRAAGDRVGLGRPIGGSTVKRLDRRNPT